MESQGGKVQRDVPPSVHDVSLGHTWTAGMAFALALRDRTPIDQVPLSEKMLLEGKSASRGTTGKVASSLQHHSVREAPLDHSCPNHTGSDQGGTRKQFL